MSKEAMKLALKKAFQLGQDYWYQADHDSYRENKKSDETLAKFRQLVDETCEALEKPDFWEGYVPEPVKPAQQEPVAYAVYHRMGGSKTLHWPEQHSEDGDHNEYRLVPLYTSPPAAQQEPVAWKWEKKKTGKSGVYLENPDQFFDLSVASIYEWTPLYTSPPAQRTWVGLSDEEQTEIMSEAREFVSRGLLDLVEAKLKEKNT